MGHELGTQQLNNRPITQWVAEQAALCAPDRIYWCDGSVAEKEDRKSVV